MTIRYNEILLYFIAKMQKLLIEGQIYNILLCLKCSIPSVSYSSYLSIVIALFFILWNQHALDICQSVNVMGTFVRTSMYPDQKTKIINFVTENQQAFLKCRRFMKKNFTCQMESAFDRNIIVSIYSQRIAQAIEFAYMCNLPRNLIDHQSKRTQNQPII